MQHTEDSVAVEQRDAEKGTDVLAQQYRVVHIGWSDLGDRYRPGLGGHSSGETASERDPYALEHLLLQAPGCDWAEELTGLIEQQGHGGVDVEQFLQSCQQLIEQLFQGELGEGDVGYRLDAP